MKTNSNYGLADTAYCSKNQVMNRFLAVSAGETLWVVGHRVTILRSGKGYTYVDVFSPGGTAGPPPHQHLDCSELFHVIEGRVDFKIGGELLQAGPGECVLVPRNTVHTFAPASESGSRVITVFEPGGFDRWFRDMGVPVDEPNGRDLSMRPEVIERILRDSLDYDMEIVTKA
jgi:mannose-6-phosphate isomerase-like protein (cupin superfamily)